MTESIFMPTKVLFKVFMVEQKLHDLGGNQNAVFLIKIVILKQSMVAVLVCSNCL